MALSIAAAVNEASVLEPVSDNWRLEGELLLGHVLGKRREWLISHSDEDLSPADAEHYRQLLARRQQAEPIAYILGHREFWDFDLTVNAAVLVPRPETEVLVREALQLLQGREGQALKLADLGTGSGAIAIALARQSRQWQVTAVDESEQALAVARGNADKLAVGNIHFQLSNWCAELPASQFDMIVSNPPYVVPGDKHLQEDGLNFEPQTALVAADNGLADLRCIAEQARRCLKNDSWLLLEHGFDQEQAVAELLTAAGYEDVRNVRDYSGQPRVSMGQWPGQD
jgi:release factor glutamine methyltransferase